MSANVPALPKQPEGRDVIELIAMDIGTEVRDYIERMYPAAVKAASLTFLVSVRNSIYNEIIAALETTDEQEIRNRLADRKAARRRLRSMVKSSRERDWEAVRAATDVTD